MNSPVTNLLIKFVAALVFGGLTFVFMNRNPWIFVFFAAVIVSLVNYYVGDLTVLPKYGPVFGYLVDGVLAALTVYLLALLLPAFNITLGSLAAFAVMIGISEYFIHAALARKTGKGLT